MTIKQPYHHLHYEGDGILYGTGHAKRKGIKDAIFLCVPMNNVEFKPEEYRFYKIIDDKPVEVPQTKNFHTGRRYINPKFYVSNKAIK